MAEEKFIMINLDDEKSKKVSEVLGNDTCKKILSYLAENSEKSEEDISKALGMKINTVEYNLNKLLDSGFIDKAKNFFWSRKGKKIPLYKVSNKKIVISPKSSLNIKSILGVSLLSVVASLAIRQIFVMKDSAMNVATDTALKTVSSPEAAGVASGVAQEGIRAVVPSTVPTFSDVPNAINLIPASNVWLWFLFGAAFAVVMYFIFNWRKM